MIPLVLLTYLADREIKNHVNATRSLGSKEMILDGRFSLRNVHNPRHPLEKLKVDEKTKQVLIKGSILAPVLYYLYAHLGKKSLLARVGSSLLLGGALGNYIERLETGYATDYIRLEKGPKKLCRYVFNLADVAIVSGAFLGLLPVLFHRSPAPGIKKITSKKEK